MTKFVVCAAIAVSSLLVQVGCESVAAPRSATQGQPLSARIAKWNQNGMEKNYRPREGAELLYATYFATLGTAAADIAGRTEKPKADDILARTLVATAGTRNLLVGALKADGHAESEITEALNQLYANFRETILPPLLSEGSRTAR